MFQWYKEAAVCYVTLMDLQPRGDLKVDLYRCRWFTRGWTLQELLAPQTVQFYDAIGTYIGNKQTLNSELSMITGIAVEHLSGEDLCLISVATRMSWAARRETKRIEDRAYSMLGIFDVNMPMIYGEGMKAFRRLQEEIIKRNNDLTIFAWEIQNKAHTTPPRQMTSNPRLLAPLNFPSSTTRTHLVSPLADSPTAFAGSRLIFSYTSNFAEFSLTNKGLLLAGDIVLHVAEVANSDSVRNLYLVLLGRANLNHVRNGGIVLRKVGPKLFCRDGSFGFVAFFRPIRTFDVSQTYILLDPISATNGAQQYRRDGLHVPLDPCAELRSTYPEALWDETDRIFLRPKGYNWAEYPMVLVMKFNVRLAYAAVSLVVLCHYLVDHGLVLKIFTQDQYPQEFDIISQAKYREEGIHVQELDLQVRSIRGMQNSTRFRIGDQYHHISASLRPYELHTFAGVVNVSALGFTVDGRDTKGIIDASERLCLC